VQIRPKLVQSSRGGATGGLGGTIPPPHKDHFWKLSKTDEKIFGVCEVTSPTIIESQPKFVTSGFQRPDLPYILSNC